MKKNMIILLVCLFGSSMLMAQSNSQLVYKQKWYYQNDKPLSLIELKSLLTKDLNSAYEYKQYDLNQKIGSGFMIGGGVLALGGCGVLLAQTASGSMSWAPVYISGAGLGVLLLGTPFMIMSNNHLKKSVNIYNSKFTSDYNEINKLDFNFGITPNGVGLVCKF
jgi:hypothetical protein